MVHVAELKQTAKHADLVYDVGMHRGEDTDYYLRKGFRVVGFEANPELAAHCRNRFADAVASQRLVIVEGAIAELPPGGGKGGTIPFYRNKDNTVWGTASSEWAERNEFWGTSHVVVEVPIVDFAARLEQHGIPHYLKIDIEGMDTLCLQALLPFAQKPDYVSIESEKSSLGALVQEELNLLTQLGYTRFKAVQQYGISHQAEPNPSPERQYVGYHFEEGSSGLFGADLPGEWQTYEALIDVYHGIFVQYWLWGDYGKLTKYAPGRWLVWAMSVLLRRPLPGWYDTHARHASVAP